MAEQKITNVTDEKRLFKLRLNRVNQRNVERLFEFSGDLKAAKEVGRKYCAVRAYTFCDVEAAKIDIEMTPTPDAD